MPLQLDDLAALDEPMPQPPGFAKRDDGEPLMLPIASIDEDPGQPRREFDADALRELAETIRKRGVLQPISVRPNAAQPERWMLNFGARRLRAAKLAEQTHIAAFIDTSIDSYDQVIENEQREGLKPLDFALFVERRLALNETQTQIARRLGKSQSYVASASALIDAPDWLMALYRQGRCQGLTELSLLRRLQTQAPDAVMVWLAQQDIVTRASLQGLKLMLSEPALAPTSESTPARTSTPPTNACDSTPALRPASTPQTIDVKAPPMSSPPSARRLLAYWREQLVEVVTHSAPAMSGALYVKTWPTANDAVREVMAAELKLVGFSDRPAAAR